MDKNRSTPPLVLCLSGLDPSGGAGLQADIETLSSLGCHPVSIATCLTVQDTVNLRSLHPVDPALIEEQVSVIVKDMPIRAIKIGILGCDKTVAVISRILAKLAHLPIILDPITGAGGGHPTSSAATQQLICRTLFQYCAVITPNLTELHSLSGQIQLQPAIEALLKFGAQHVLVTDSAPDSSLIVNTLWDRNGQICEEHWQRQPHIYHGSGCTLASAIAAYLAHGKPVKAACQQAQLYTWQSIRLGQQLGSGQHIPRRAAYPSHLAEVTG